MKGSQGATNKLRENGPKNTLRSELESGSKAENEKLNFLLAIIPLYSTVTVHLDMLATLFFVRNHSYE